MAATSGAGYSLALVGKCGPKTIFQSIRRADSHVLIGVLAQDVCDDFNRGEGFVVTRVQAARDDTGGPYRDVPLTEQVELLQDLKYRHLLCSFVERDEENEEKEDTPAQNAFTVLMANDFY